MDAYRRTGRGGAGNFYSPADVEEVNKAAASEDLEAQSVSPDAASRAASNAQPPPEYLHTGRGGAGNWVAPKELSTSGLSQYTPPTSSPAVAPSGAPIYESKPTYRGGRGGAGNYVDFEEQEREKREAEERQAKAMEERAMKDVEAGLARPAKAYGGEGGRGGVFEMGEMS